MTSREEAERWAKVHLPCGENWNLQAKITRNAHLAGQELGAAEERKRILSFIRTQRAAIEYAGIENNRDWAWWIETELKKDDVIQSKGEPR